MFLRKFYSRKNNILQKNFFLCVFINLVIKIYNMFNLYNIFNYQNIQYIWKVKVIKKIILITFDIINNVSIKVL